MTLISFNLKSITVLSVATILMGCSGYQYVASPRYVPLNEKKGELTANLYLSSIQVGYSFSNKFSAFATGFQRIPSLGATATLDAGKNHRTCESSEINIGLSYFQKGDNSIFEILSGTGMGRMSYKNNFTHDKNQQEGYNFEMRARVKNVFVQPSFGWKPGNPDANSHFAIAVFTKFNLVHYDDIKTEGSFGSASQPDSGIDYFSKRTEANLFFIEPGVLMKFGSKTVKGIVQVSPVINASGRALHYNMISINMGVTMNFDLLKNKNPVGE
jgi:hypothetical protein